MESTWVNDKNLNLNLGFIVQIKYPHNNDNYFDDEMDNNWHFFGEFFYIDSLGGAKNIYNQNLPNHLGGKKSNNQPKFVCSNCMGVKELVFGGHQGGT
jgi:hypothetical protein